MPTPYDSAAHAELAERIISRQIGAASPAVSPSRPESGRSWPSHLVGAPELVNNLSRLA
jgi:hypothetical protein